MPEATPGKLISGKYRLLSELGHGAMGVVYRAEQLDVEGRLQRQVALKTLLPHLSTIPTSPAVSCARCVSLCSFAARIQ